MATKEEARVIETQIEIDAPVETVWKALTEPEELTNWFPLEARLTPGVGGSLFYSWGGDLQGDNRIEVWEPNRHLRTTWFEPASETPDRLMVDYMLESHGGKTVLRLVHSGFGADAKWDEEYDGINRGWTVELLNLRHYLECKLGKKRHVAFVRVGIDLSFPQAWERLWSADGLLAQGEMPGPNEGDRYAFTTAQGDRLEGRTLAFIPPNDFSGTVENLNDAVFRAAVEKCGAGPEALFWLSSWDMSTEQVEEIGGRWKELLTALMA
jgi:uncharacterized protein YndB with AHSA1/START domain